MLLTGSGTHDLPGLRTRPYASYLAALGLLRLLSEQADENAQGWWQAGHFHLRSAVEPGDFLLHHYAPTPIASPWNGGSGFHPGENADAREALTGSSEGRFGPYRETLAVIAGVLTELGMTDKPTSLEQKATLLRSLHGRLPSGGRRWLDAVVTISEDDLHYSRLFFSGGNDAKFEMSRPFLANLYQLFLDPDRKPLHSSQALQALLQDRAAPVSERQTHGALDPFTVAALNGTSDGDATYLGNPWSYILALEGLLTLAPYHGKLAATAETEEGQDDLLLPLWSEPLNASQVHELLQGAKPEAYQRFAVPRRNGRAHFVIPVALRAVAPSFVPPDQTAEYGLALSLAGLGRNLSEPLHLRPHMVHFAGRDLCEKMIRLARCRQQAGTQVLKHPNRAGIVRFNDPFWSMQPAQPRHIQSFLQGRISEGRLSHLLHALVLEPQPTPLVGEEEEVALLPFPYRLAKLAFHQHDGDRRPAPIPILDHLCAQRWQVALDVAGRFLSARHPELPAAPSHAWTCDGRRVAAALLFPISESCYLSLLDSVGG